MVRRNRSRNEQRFKTFLQDALPQVKANEVDDVIKIIGTDKTYQKLANAWISKTKDKAQKILDLLSRVN